MLYSMLVMFTTSVTEISREEILDDACELKANATLQVLFKESVWKRLSIKTNEKPGM